MKLKILTSQNRERARKVIASICLSAGVLAIANMQTIWQEYQHTDHQETHALINVNRHWVARDKTAAPTGNHAYKPLQSALSQSLEQDELHELNPFEHLSSLDPLQEIMRKGVKEFQRETFRSPAYQEETGYDMISYSIEQSDGSHSTILAYLEHSNPGASRNVGAPDERIPFVVFMVSNGEGTHHSFYRGGDLLEQSDLTTAESQAFIAQRLSSGIPFLSVSR